MRVPCHFPQVPVGILKVTRVTSPEGILRRFDDDRTRFPCLLHDVIDLGPGRNVMSKSEIGGTRLARGKAGIMRETFARPDGKLESGLQIEEGNRSMLELVSDDTFRLQPKAVTVEIERSFQIIDAERNECYALLHVRHPNEE